MTKSIHFFTEDLKFSLRGKKKIISWVEDCAKHEKCIPGEICIVFCSDEYLLKMNRKYLKHNTLTDIISFPLSEEQEVVSGDIFISLPRVRENAKIFKQSVENELNRVIIHGVLHLLGYDDTTEDDKCIMRNKENLYLDKFSYL